MESKNKLATPPQKVLLLYQAVADMIKEGADISSMKVSDITARAGIGKGTAYEYFSSREEIITKALTYDVEEKLAAIEKIVEQSADFESLIMTVFDYIEEKFGENQMFCSLVRIGTGSWEVSASFQKEYEWIQCHLRKMEFLMDKIMQIGQEEGVIEGKNACLNRMALSAQIMAFATYLVTVRNKQQTSITVQEAKRFAYESLVKSMKRIS